MEERFAASKMLITGVEKPLPCRDRCSASRPPGGASAGTCVTAHDPLLLQPLGQKVVVQREEARDLDCGGRPFSKS